MEKEILLNTYCIYCKGKINQIKEGLEELHHQWHEECSKEIIKVNSDLRGGEKEIIDQIHYIETDRLNSLWVYDGTRIKQLFLEFYDINLVLKYLNSTNLIVQCYIFHVLVLKREESLYEILMQKLEENSGKEIKYHGAFTCFPYNILVNRYFFEIAKENLTKEQKEYIIERYFSGKDEPMFLLENDNRFKRIFNIN